MVCAWTLLVWTAWIVGEPDKGEMIKKLLGEAGKLAARALDWLTNVEQGTWVRHGLQGLGFTLAFALIGLWLGFNGALFGFAFTIGAFMRREVDQALEYLLAGRLSHDRLVDGIVDFMAPYGASLLVVVAFEIF